MDSQDIRTVIAAARRRFLRRLQAGPTTFTDAIRGLPLPDGVDGRVFGAMVAQLHRDRIIRPVGYVASANRCCHSRLWELVDSSIGGAK
ncbi:hypothetical protein [Allorhodopirellula heiligendammensis]|uniref:Uncharacterized protein n=1 Tax=Allorhodopirellula heiligendammensis TaxID=2714739 RepID=A0A5C6BYG9_9BACT|nr:hypothetical protein [Allorhodopirellula heiligendammensis]TWU16938.1 hypothetical protein Poly21_41470 [Allorhodopirellula heiligendammensis]